MSVRRTHQEFLDEIAIKGIQVDVLEGYINSQTPLSCKCRKCGLIWKIRPNNLLRGYGCPSCAGQYRRTPEEFVRDLGTKNPNIELVGIYVDTQTKTDFVCKICNHKWSTTPANLLSGRGCPRCGIEKRSSALRKSPETFQAEITRINPNITLLSRYINGQTNVKCRCEICSYEWSAVAQSLVQGTGCPKCSGRMKKTNEEFVDEIALINPNIELLSQYINAKTNIRCRCKECGFEWESLPSSLRKGSGCYKCKKVYVRNRDEFIADLYAISPNIEVVGEYKNTQTKVHCKCRLCNHEWLVLPSKLLSGRGCPKCASKKRGDALRKSHQQFVKELNRVNCNITIVGRYNGQNSNILCACNVCGHEWNALPNNLLRGQGCPQCGKKIISDKLRKTHEQFAAELKEKNSKIEIISEYIRDSNKISCRCCECGHTWEALPSNLLKGSACPSCAHIQTSFVERSIFYFLQYAIGEGKVLSRNRSAIGKELDIYLPDAKMAIEPGSWYWHKDKRKQDYEKRYLCNEKGIRLITIYDSFGENRDAYGFDDDIITIRHNLGEPSYRNELDSLIQHLLNVLKVQCYYSDEVKAQLYTQAKEAASRKSSKAFADELFLINPNIELLGNYQGEKGKTPCRCRVCGYVWESTYNHLIRRKQGCPVCNTQKRRVINLRTGEVYESASEAARQIGVSNNAVGMVCRGQAKTCKGDRWSYVEALSDTEKTKYGLA